MSLNDQVQQLKELQKIVLNLDANNTEESIEMTMNFLNESFPVSFNITLSNLIYASYLAQTKDVNIYIQYIKGIEKKEEELKIEHRIIEDFSKILTWDADRSYYLLEKMIEQNLISSQLVKTSCSLYFAHYKSHQEIYSLKNNARFDIKFFRNILELSKNHWELHKKYIEEGVNPNEISKIIRNDEIEKLQELSSQNNFDFNQRIEPSLYERCDFINKKNVTLIDFAAYFGAIQCFKYLLMNNAKVENTGKYAIAGGNLEIIHLCEQNHSSFENAYETAIEFHQNDIFYYLYDKKMIEINDLTSLGIKCISCSNYEILSFLFDKGIEVNDSVIYESVKMGNMVLTKYFTKGKIIPKDIIVYATQSGNIELVKLVLEQKSININAKGFYLSYLIFILIILYFKIIFGNNLYYFIQHLYGQQ